CPSRVPCEGLPNGAGCRVAKLDQPVDRRSGKRGPVRRIHDRQHFCRVILGGPNGLSGGRVPDVDDAGVTDTGATAGESRAIGRKGSGQDLLGGIAQLAEQTARSGVPEPYGSRAEAFGAGLEPAPRVAAVAAARSQERTVLRERDGIHLLKVTG